MHYGIAFRLLVLSLMVHVSMSATAAPVTWTLDSVVLDSGATIAGSFTYDSDTNTYSSVNVTVTGAATPAHNTTYDTPLFVFGFSNSSSTFLRALSGACPGGDCTGQPVLVLPFTDPVLLENSPVTLTNGTALWTCSNSDCSNRSGSPTNRTSQGSVIANFVPPVPVTAVTVPTMSAYGLVLTMLGLLLLAGRRLRVVAKRK